MGYYKIYFKKSAEKELRSLDKKLITRIINLIDELSDNPIPINSRKLVGSERTYRVRVGEYRVIYTIDHELNNIEIQKIAHRKEVYK